MHSVTFYDAEFLTAPGAPQRFWCGPDDPDPLTIQLGAVRLSLAPPFEISRQAAWYVLPMDRDGTVAAVDPLVTRLLGITDQDLAEKGLPLVDALASLDAFSQGDTLFAWGKDELLTLAASLFVQTARSPIPVQRFRSAVPLLVAAGESSETTQGLRSNTLCGHFDLEDPGKAHDAAGDALSVATVFRYLLVNGRLARTDFERAAGRDVSA